MHNELESIESLKDKLILIQDQPVLLDRDVAKLYGVETKRVNEAVKNNPEKFPCGYILNLDNEELSLLRSKISTSKPTRGGTRYTPTLFTEKGLYMLATILKPYQERVNTDSLLVKLKHNSERAKFESKIPDRFYKISRNSH